MVIAFNRPKRVNFPDEPVRILDIAAGARHSLALAEMKDGYLEVDVHSRTVGFPLLVNV